MRSVAILGFCSAVLIDSVGLAQAPNVDWKFYGGALLGKGDEYCFYDAKGVAAASNGYIRVWTKCLSRKSINAIDIEKQFDGKILEATAEKVAHYYVPPIAKVDKIDTDQAMTIIQYEQTANIGNIQPRSRIFYELDCSGQMLRELSIYIEQDGKVGTRDKPSDWKHVPPEGNGASLLKILCPQR
jgi:hypothetical protein